ncbi:MAG: nucleotidyltransferase family protein [Paracoccaceae bacterium]
MASSAHILILAAGTSSRMRGRDKLLETIDGVPLLRIVAQRALATGCPVTIALPVFPHARYDALDGLEVDRLPIPGAEQGMSVSLRASVQALQNKAKRLLLLLADLPEITTEHLQLVLDAPKSAPDALVWRGATEDGAPGHPVLFDQALFPNFANITGDNGAQSVVAAARPAVQLVTLNGMAARQDLDTPEEWARWRALNAK